MKNYFVIILFFPVLFACKNKTESLHDIFKNIETVKHKKIINDSTYIIGSSGKMLIVDSFLITLDYKNERMFHLFDIKNNNYISNLGLKGQGPNEFLHPLSLIYSSSHDFLSYDLLDNSLKLIDLDSLKKKEVSYKKLLSFNSISHSTVFPTKYNNYVGLGLYTFNMFKLIDVYGNEINSFMDYPIEKGKKSEKIDHRNIALAYQGVLNISPDKNKIVYASHYGTILGIYNVNETSINQNFLLICDYPQYTVQNEGGGMSSPLTREGISAFRDIYVTDKYIYSLYSGNKISELRERAFEAKDIYVFDWEGNPVVHYHLDVPINNIAVLPNDKKIYAISNLPDPTLIEFEIDL
ncbi:BF3164 family lipoprotein [Proteiniphilum propionicum]|jgi:hypothetical protein|uniref:BF3164 family lipoprotein n=1 Tax=Proteiniphilum propionicum TaxID=2829812 RepID=UPI001EEB82ED|nr:MULTISPECIES: BF3164 family lipoprotein [Proteiniphilum]ULB33798.1 hypothetical protein KDN43_12480 [Proteiniphilum propionicum]